MKWLLTALALLFAAPVHAQGTVTMAGNVQQGINGQPLAGALLYIYVINTTATPQLAFQDINLTQALPWPVPADVTGRLPFFYLASGSVHLRMTDSGGGIVFDYPNVLVIGGSGGGGGGGGGQVVDPNAIASTGDIKFRLSGELLPGWVVLNGQTIGGPLSGASASGCGATPQQPSGTCQNLFVYLWANCPNAHCPVTPGGRGATALSDFQANKQLQLMDMRDSMPTGRDCMGNACLGGILLSNISSGGTDKADTPGAFGGAPNHPVTLCNLPALSLLGSVTICIGSRSHSHALQGSAVPTTGGALNVGTGGSTLLSGGNISTKSAATLPAMSGTGTASLAGSNTALPIMSPFKLATYYIRL